jgi:hypothetical protein
MKTALKLKRNPIWEYIGLIFYPIKPSAGLFFLIKSRETIPLSKKLQKFQMIKVTFRTAVNVIVQYFA